MRATFPDYFPLPSKNKLCQFYSRTQCTPLSKHLPCKIYKTYLIMLYKAKVAVCSEIYRVEILVVLNLVARKVTARL